MINSKKNLLFIMNSLTNGGAENSLINFLKELDYEKYNAVLFLFNHSGFFIDKLPKQVKVLPEPSAYKYFDMATKKALWLLFIKLRWDVFIIRIIFSIIVKTEKTSAVRETKMLEILIILL